MKRTRLAMTAVLVAAIWAAAPAASQEARFEHVHLTVSDFRGAATWYVTHMGGKPEGTYVSFGDFNIRFHLEKDAEIESSSGSVIDHIAFSFSDLDAKMRDPKCDWFRLAGELDSPDWELLLSKDVNQLTNADLVWSYVLAGFVLEAYPHKAASILAEVGKGRASSDVLREELGMSLVMLAERVPRWAAER